MGMFGGLFGSRKQRAPGAYTPETRPMDSPESVLPAKLGYDDPGGLHDKLYRLSASLQAAGGNQAGADAISQGLEKQQAAAIQAAYRTAQANQEPSVIRSLRAAGINPASPEGRKIIQDNLAAPHYLTLGGAETGQTVINAGAMAPAGPPPPQVGAVVDGHKFLGGDPSQPTSWQKVQ